MSRSDPSLDNRIVSIEDEFYNKKFYFSYSSLSKLLYSPKLFYSHYVLNLRDDQLLSHLIDGKIIHCLLLDNGSFDSQFIVSPGNLPGDNNRLIIDKLYQIVQVNNRVDEEIKSFDEEILQILKDINLHQKLKTDQQRIEKVITEETLNYYNYLKVKGNRDILDQETLDRCKESVRLLKDNQKISDLLNLNNRPDTTTINEKELRVEPKNHLFGFKGILDNLVFDKINKIVYINDLKTTGKTLTDFKETINFYKYDLQAALYYLLVKNNFEVEDWRIEFHFIVIDKYLQVYSFLVSDNTMSEWLNKLQEAVMIANYHYSNREFTLPMEFSKGSVIL